MKKLCVLMIMLGTMAVVVPPVDAKTDKSVSGISVFATAEQPRRWRNRRGNRPYSIIRTRVVRRGFRVYRETYRITYLPNGRTRTRIISRVRIR